MHFECLKVGEIKLDHKPCSAPLLKAKINFHVGLAMIHTASESESFTAYVFSRPSKMRG